MKTCGQCRRPLGQHAFVKWTGYILCHLCVDRTKPPFVPFGIDRWKR